MLKLRIITALLLLLIVVGAVFYLERSAFAWAAGVFFLAAGWEWSGMMRAVAMPTVTMPAAIMPTKAGLKVAAFWRVLWCALLVTALVASEVYRPEWVLTLLPLWWLLALLLVLLYPRATALWQRLPVQALIGWLLLAPSWQAIVQVQDTGVLGLEGPWALMFILLWVWAADTGAYFAGRALGRHKLAPSVSPGKTIEGLIGGVSLALLVAGLVIWFAPVQGDKAIILAVALITVLASVLGDLFESMVKRQAGIKDSGTMLPGHGGMLDRIDSVTAALPVALAAISWVGLPGGL